MAAKMVIASAPLNPKESNQCLKRYVSEPTKRFSMISDIVKTIDQDDFGIPISDTFSYIATAPLNIKSHKKRYASLNVYPIGEYDDTLPIDEEEVPKVQQVQQVQEITEKKSPQINTRSSFEIESFESSQSLSPAFPPINDTIPISSSPPPLELRKSLLSNSNFYTGDSFRDYMEDRLIRWRPTNSQHNSDIILNGNHPFQARKFGTPVSGNTSSFFSWFGSNKSKKPDIENQATPYFSAEQSPQRHGQQDLYEHSDGQYLNPVLNEERDLGHILKQVHFTQNSSNSILPTTIDSTAAVFMTPGPGIQSFTPNAIPFTDFQLNFNTRNDELEVTGNVYDSMGNELIELINGSENFLTSCWQSVIELFQC